MKEIIRAQGIEADKLRSTVTKLAHESQQEVQTLVEEKKKLNSYGGLKKILDRSFVPLNRSTRLS